MVYQYGQNLRDLLSAVGSLSDEQLRSSPARANPISFHLWHIARWADYLQSVLSEITPRMRAKGPPRPEIWVAERLAEVWGFAPAELGRYETGTHMADAAVTELAFPPKQQLVAYAERCFRLAEESVAALSDEDLLWPAEIAAGREPWFSPPKEPNLVIRLLMLSSRHDARHLGMVEALKGLQGQRGTATA